MFHSRRREGYLPMRRNPSHKSGGHPLRSQFEVIEGSRRTRIRKRYLVAFATIVLAISGYIGWYIDQPIQLDEVVMENGIEIPLATYVATHAIPADPSITDLRDADGQNGMWYQTLKSGTIVRLWRDDGSEYIHVQFANGVTGKCTSLASVKTGNPWACFTHVKQYDSGWERLDYIYFEVKAPKENLPKIRHIQRGGTGEVKF